MSSRENKTLSCPPASCWTQPGSPDKEELEAGGQGSPYRQPPPLEQPEVLGDTCLPTSIPETAFLCALPRSQQEPLLSKSHKLGIGLSRFK
jgi:hypothetical protein